jgi:cystathionine beta-lyase/cystathionine gamma-synthase
MHSKKGEPMRFETKAVHAGQDPDPTTGAITPPIYQTSTYVQAGVGEDKGYQYARSGNPTRTNLEHALAAVEGTRYGLAFSSGMGAINTIIQLLSSGDHVICPTSVYGGTFRIIEFVYRQFGIAADYVEIHEPANIEAAIRPETKLVWLESPANPLMTCCDIAAISKLAHARGLKVVVDNTFATPYFQRPAELGADIIIHSTTKYLGGHSDVIGGGVCVSDDALYERLAFCQNAVGPVPGPVDCWLVLRGLATLAVRMRQHEANAMKVAEFMESQPKARKVFYPGLPSHPQHEIAKRQMTGYSGMLSVDLDTDFDGANRFLKAVRLFSLGESLGSVKSLICMPARMTHKSMTQEARDRAGITDSLIRLSVGLEHADDLIEDLDTALRAV